VRPQQATIAAVDDHDLDAAAVDEPSDAIEGGHQEQVLADLPARAATCGAGALRVLVADGGAVHLMRPRSIVGEAS
jgi:hypothetical protein